MFPHGFLRPLLEHEERFSLFSKISMSDFMSDGKYPIEGTMPSANPYHRRHMNRQVRKEILVKRNDKENKAMNIEFKCPQCGKPVTADDSYRGKVVECPHCERGIVVPKENGSHNGSRFKMRA